MRLEGARVVVTGAASGIGRALVRGLERDRCAIHPSPLFHALQRFAWPVLAIYRRFETHRFLRAERRLRPPPPPPSPPRGST